MEAQHVRAVFLASPMEKKKPGPDHYRYVDEMDPKGLEVTCKKYVVVGETEQCWYIPDELHNNLLDGSQRESLLKQHRKRVLKDGGEHGRRFAYIDKPWRCARTNSASLADAPCAAVA